MEYGHYRGLNTEYGNVLYTGIIYKWGVYSCMPFKEAVRLLSGSGLKF